MKTLTREKKFMNMAKLGTVLPCGNYFQRPLLFSGNNNLHSMLYTLCEVEKDRTRHGSRNGLAFYIPRIMGGALFLLPLPQPPKVGKVRVLCNTRTKSHGWHSQNYFQFPATPSGSKLGAEFTPKNNCSGFFSKLFWLFCGAFPAIFGDIGRLP